MESSTIAMIFLVALIVFFLLLVIMTVVVIAGGKSKKEHEADDESEYEEEADDTADSEPDIQGDDIFEEADREADSGFRNDDITEELAVPNVQPEPKAKPKKKALKHAEQKPDDMIDSAFAPDEQDEADDAALAHDEKDEADEAAFAPDEQDEADDTALAHDGKDEADDTALAHDEKDDMIDSAFAPETEVTGLTDELIAESVREAEAMAAVVIGSDISAETMFGISEEMSKFGSRKKSRSKSTVSSDEDFYWFNKMDVAERPSYKTAEMYYHYFNLPKDCIEDLLVEMYDCALVRTEEIRYIAYGIEPKAVSMKEILSYDSDSYSRQKIKEPSTQDLVRIYEKWCGYVDKLFDKVEIHADELTIEAIRNLLCEYGRSDVEVLIEGK